MRRAELILALLITWALAGVAHAQAPVTLDVFQAAGTKVRRGRAIPLYVTLMNNGPAIDGAKIVVEVIDYSRTVRCRVEQPVALPEGARKRVLMLVPEYSNYVMSQTALPVRLEDAAGRTIAEPKPPANYPVMTMDNDVMVLVVSPDKSADYSYLTTYGKLFGTTANSASIYVEQVKAGSLPTHWAGLESADLVVIHDAQALQTTAEQQRALLDYVAGGGQLLLVSNGDPAQFNGLGLGAAMPARPTGSVALDQVSGAAPGARAQFGAGSTLLLQMTPAPDARVLRRYGALPLLVARPYGLGVVYLAGVNIANAHVLSDNGLRSWWSDLMADSRTRQKQRVHIAEDDVLAYPPEMTPPSIGFLSLFMLAYVVLVGPLNYMLLKRRDRMLWSWVTVPLMAVAFTMVSYFISYGAKGSEIVLREFTVSRMHQGSPMVATRAWLALFSPRRASYDVRLPGRTLVRSAMGEDNQTLNVSWEDGSLARDLQVPMWSMRRLHGDAITELKGSVRMQLRLEKNRVVGEVVNDSGIDLGPCMLVLDGRVTAPLHLQPGANKIDEAVNQTNIGAALRAAAPSGTDVQGLDSTIRNALDSGDLSKARPTPILVAWPSVPLVEVRATPGASRAIGANLLVVW